MTDWLLGILICIVIVIIINSISKPVNKGMTVEDYDKMKKERQEEDLEEQRFNDYIESEIEINKENLSKKGN